MKISVEELLGSSEYKLVKTVDYHNMISFVVEYIKKISFLMIIYWGFCLAALGLSLSIRFSIAGGYPVTSILLHSLLGLIVFPILIIPIHELLHIIPYSLTGARDIRVGMDLRQYMFYVTAHRYVAGPVQFCITALVPFVVISLASAILVFVLPGLWKWSLSLFLLSHATMCSGDFALLNFYWLSRPAKILTWDDTDEKIAYFYEVSNQNKQ